MVIGANEHALSFTTAKMTAAEWSVSGSPVHFRDGTMGALNAPARVVSRYYIRRRALYAPRRHVNLIFWASINVHENGPSLRPLPNACRMHAECMSNSLSFPRYYRRFVASRLTVEYHRQFPYISRTRNSRRFIDRHRNDAARRFRTRGICSTGS
jgi:hypothetical protein